LVTDPGRTEPQGCRIGTKRAVVHTDNGKLDVTPPFPYSTVVTLPAATAGAAKLTLTVRLDLLVETAPESNSYCRSTALDLWPCRCSRLVPPDDVAVVDFGVTALCGTGQTSVRSAPDLAGLMVDRQPALSR
jgi:hypothetical protein